MREFESSHSSQPVQPLEILSLVIPGDEAFRSLKDSACPLVKKG